jgi:predicted transcriptional regulator
MNKDMDKNKTSKKALKSLIEDSTREALSHLELPEATKKVKKLISRHAKKLAAAYTDILRREDKKKKKVEKFIDEAVKGGRAIAKNKKSRNNKVAAHVTV